MKGRYLVGSRPPYLVSTRCIIRIVDSRWGVKEMRGARRVEKGERLAARRDERQFGMMRGRLEV